MTADRAEWAEAVRALRAGLGNAFEVLLAHCSAPEADLDRATSAGGWTAREVLEHVHLCDHFLLLLADKLAVKSARRAARGDAWPAHSPAFAHLAALASSELRWEAPEHMRPTGGVARDPLQRDLEADRDRALALLDAQPHGEGTLHRIRMSRVEGGDDRLDLYQYLEVLRLHAVRHAAQLARLDER